MTAVSLLATVAFVPGISFFQPADILIGDGTWGIDTVVGTGPLLTERRSFLLEYRLLDGLGRTLGSSDGRGLAFGYSHDSRDPILDNALDGMREGSERMVWIPADRFPQGIGSLVPPSTELTLTLRALQRG